MFQSQNESIEPGSSWHTAVRALFTTKRRSFRMGGMDGMYGQSIAFGDLKGDMTRCFHPLRTALVDLAQTANFDQGIHASDLAAR